MTSVHRHLGRLAAPDIATALKATSVLCLPIGSQEQHGPHLPLNTDTVIADRFTRRLLDRYGERHDLWMMPAIPYGLSLEHAWSAGTISLTVTLLTELLDVTCGQYRHATPARNLAIINGHGGNRGLLEAAVHELRHRHDLNICVLHPSSLADRRRDSDVPEIHAGIDETSMMLALAPHDVHVDRIPPDFAVLPHHAELARQAVLDRGVTWPWTSQDGMASHGVIGGDPRQATAGHGEHLIDSALRRCDDLLHRLTEAIPQRQPQEGESNRCPHPPPARNWPPSSVTESSSGETPSPPH